MLRHLFSNGVNPCDIERGPARFLRPLRHRKYCQCGLKGTKIGWNEMKAGRFLKQETGFWNYSALNMHYPSRKSMNEWSFGWDRASSYEWLFPRLKVWWGLPSWIAKWLSDKGFLFSFYFSLSLEIGMSMTFILCLSHHCIWGGGFNLFSCFTSAQIEQNFVPGWHTKRKHSSLIQMMRFNTSELMIFRWNFGLELTLSCVGPFKGVGVAWTYFVCGVDIDIWGLEGGLW